MDIKKTIFILIILFNFSCKKNSKAIYLSNNIECSDLLMKEIVSGKEIIRFESFAKFDWDSLMILTPYTCIDKIEEKHNINLKPVAHFGIKNRDDINLIVFLKNKKSIHAIEFPIHLGDFSKNKIELIKKSKANYKMILSKEQTTNGKPLTRLIKE